MAKILTIRSVDIERNLVEIDDSVLVGYEHFCSIANKPPEKGFSYRYTGSIALGAELTAAIYIPQMST